MLNSVSGGNELRLLLEVSVRFCFILTFYLRGDVRARYVEVKL